MSRVHEALAFDDVLLVPGYSQVLPSATDTAHPAHPHHHAQHPADLGSDGHRHARPTWPSPWRSSAVLGVIHKNLEPAEQAAQVRRVKKFEFGMVVDPLTIHPDQTLADVKRADDHQADQRHPGGRA